MRTLHVGLRVSDLDRSLAFYTAVGYTVAGTVEDTAFGSLTRGGHRPYRRRRLRTHDAKPCTTTTTARIATKSMPAHQLTLTELAGMRSISQPRQATSEPVVIGDIATRAPALP